MKKPKTRQFEVTEGRQLKSIDLTPTWTALVPALLDAYANAEPLRRETIREEFLLMAKAADTGVDLTKQYNTGAPGPNPALRPD